MRDQQFYVFSNRPIAKRIDSISRKTKKSNITCQRRFNWNNLHKCNSPRYTGTIWFILWRILVIYLLTSCLELRTSPQIPPPCLMNEARNITISVFCHKYHQRNFPINVQTLFVRNGLLTSYTCNASPHLKLGIIPEFSVAIVLGKF